MKTVFKTRQQIWQEEQEAIDAYKKKILADPEAIRENLRELGILDENNLVKEDMVELVQLILSDSTRK